MCSDSGSDSDFDSDSGSETKYKMINTLIVKRISAVQARTRNVTFPIGFGFYSFGRKIFIFLVEVDFPYEQQWGNTFIFLVEFDFP